MYKLLKLEKNLTKGGIYHLRKDGRLVKKFNLSDADIISISDFRRENENFAYFIIECENSDYIKYDGKQHKVIKYMPYIDDFKLCEDDFFWESKYHIYMSEYIFEEALYIKELFDEVEMQHSMSSSTFCKKFEKLLASQLRRLFSLVILEDNSNDAEKIESSSSIWRIYSYILSQLKKTANDFVDSKIIDNFFINLSRIYDIPQIDSILKTKTVEVSREASLEIEKSKDRLEETKKVVKEKIYSYFNELKEKNIYRIISRNHFTYANMPCGDVEIITNFLRPSIYIHIDSDFNWYYDLTIDLTNEFRDVLECVKDTFEIIGEIY